MNNYRFLLLFVVAITAAVSISCYTLFNDVYITSPVDGEYTTETTVSIEIYSSGEIANLEVFHNGVLLGGSTSYTVDVTRNAANTVSVDGYDEIGNLVDFDSVTFYHDSIDPSLTVNMTPSGRTLTFTGLVSDNFIIEEFTHEHHTYAYIEGAITPNANKSWQLILPDMPYSDESQAISFTAVDAAGNPRTVSCPYLLTDITSPTIATTSPTDGQTYDAGSITLSGSATDDYELGVLWYALDNDALIEIATSALGSFNTSISIFAVGAHEIRFIAADSFFNVTQATMTIYISSP